VVTGKKRGRREGPKPSQSPEQNPPLLSVRHIVSSAEKKKRGRRNELRNISRSPFREKKQQRRVLAVSPGLSHSSLFSSKEKGEKGKKGR